MSFLSQPWPWYIAGPSIAVVMFLLLYFGKTFGMSSNLRTLCAIGGAGKRVKFFKMDWRDYQWNLIVVLGAILGGFIAHTFLKSPEAIALSEQTMKDLSSLGFTNAGDTLLPKELFDWENVFTIKGFSILIIGGFLVGFGTRYAGGCTSGHAITGLSSLQLPSLVAVVGFFLGGLIMIHFIYPILF
ncbi:YeeE/YedE thiosulfate transporter family protein [Winogradskyella sp.]|uniref:YeeE/YedE family protein n=1 Tax=Winogradskyella sp. TaxID=1883156 RepID=UPI002633D10A|nr:YeeE/YedE thiosulfate transporter family protein [Winogradskyella sp.]